MMHACSGHARAGQLSTDNGRCMKSFPWVLPKIKEMLTKWHCWFPSLATKTCNERNVNGGILRSQWEFKHHLL